MGLSFFSISFYPLEAGASPCPSHLSYYEGGLTFAPVVNPGDFACSFPKCNTVIV